MKQAPEYKVVDKEDKVLVYRLRKLLYGLKQAGRQWYQKLVKIMTRLGFERCEVLGDALLRPMFPLIILCHLCTSLLIVTSSRQSALVAPVAESNRHMT